MSDFITSQIRTVTPVIVGAVIAWLSSKGIDVSPEGAAGLVSFLTALFSGVYYLIVRLLETKVSDRFGVLLGSKKSPKY